MRTGNSDFVPQTYSWDGERRACDQNEKYIEGECCAQTHLLGRAIDKAYSHGLQTHEGIKAIQDYPCVPNPEFDRLFNDLHDKSKTSGIETPLPEGFDPSKDKISVTDEIVKFCKEVVFERIGRELNLLKDREPIAFSDKVWRHCSYIGVEY